MSLPNINLTVSSSHSWWPVPGNNVANVWITLQCSSFAYFLRAQWILISFKYCSDILEYTQLLGFFHQKKAIYNKTIIISITLHQVPAIFWL